MIGDGGGTLNKALKKVFSKEMTFELWLRWQAGRNHAWVYQRGLHVGQYKGPEMEKSVAHLRSINDVHIVGVGDWVKEN